MNTVNKQELGPGTSLYVKLIIRQETPSFKLFINPFWPGFYVICSNRLPLCRRMLGLKLGLFVCLERQYSRSINIVGKDDGIRMGALESR
jgi:hypothetical protein